MTFTTTTGAMPKNLELARELIAHHISEMCPIHRENEPIVRLLDAGNEYELILLPGDSLDAIVDNLKMVLKLASESVHMPTTGHDRENHHYEATHQREEIRLFGQVGLALLGSPHHG